jgi:hypothetical protein
MPAKKLAEVLDRRFDQLKRWRRPWEPIWEEIASFVLPEREFNTRSSESRGLTGGSFQIQGKRNKRIGEKVFDGSPIAALQLMSDSWASSTHHTFSGGGQPSKSKH